MLKWRPPMQWRSPSWRSSSSIPTWRALPAASQRRRCSAASRACCTSSSTCCRPHQTATQSAALCDAVLTLAPARIAPQRAAVAWCPRLASHTGQHRPFQSPRQLPRQQILAVRCRPQQGDPGSILSLRRWRRPVGACRQDRHHSSLVIAVSHAVRPQHRRSELHSVPCPVHSICI